MAFKKGDLVELKSGGPVMTVNAAYPDGDVNTVWFSGKKMEQGMFSQETLKPATAEKE